MERLKQSLEGRRVPALSQPVYESTQGRFVDSHSIFKHLQPLFLSKKGPAPLIASQITKNNVHKDEADDSNNIHELHDHVSMASPNVIMENMRLRWLQPLHNGPHRLHSWEEVVVMVQKWPTPVLHRLRKIISNGFLACDVGLTHILVDFYRIYNPLNSSWQLTLTSAQLIQQDSKVEIWFLICFVAKTKKLDNDLRTSTSKAVPEYAEGMNGQVHLVFISIPDDMIDSFSAKS